MRVSGSNRPVIIAETNSLGAGGVFSSSVHLIDDLRTITGYYLSSSATGVLLIKQSVNSAFTNAVTTTVIVNSQNYAVEYNYTYLVGTYVNYNFLANSATQFTMNMVGTSV